MQIEKQRLTKIIQEEIRLALQEVAADPNIALVEKYWGVVLGKTINVPKEDVKALTKIVGDAGINKHTKASAAKILFNHFNNIGLPRHGRRYKKAYERLSGTSGELTLPKQLDTAGGAAFSDLVIYLDQKCKDNPTTCEVLSSALDAADYAILAFIIFETGGVGAPVGVAAWAGIKQAIKGLIRKGIKRKSIERALLQAPKLATRPGVVGEFGKAMASGRGKRMMALWAWETVAPTVAPRIKHGCLSVKCLRDAELAAAQLGDEDAKNWIKGLTAKMLDPSKVGADFVYRDFDDGNNQVAKHCAGPDWKKVKEIKIPKQIQKYAMKEKGKQLVSWVFFGKCATLNEHIKIHVS
tara:strand:+ start:777 stop:1835 length:1059 start_codon:yes stop_codon:yes gene_type:complete